MNKLYRIKKLKWERNIKNSTCESFWAKTLDGSYVVTRFRVDRSKDSSDWGLWDVELNISGYGRETIGISVRTLIQAKQKAQEDWEYRLRPDLVAVRRV